MINCTVIIIFSTINCYKKCAKSENLYYKILFSLINCKIKTIIFIALKHSYMREYYTEYFNLVYFKIYVPNCLLKTSLSK